MEKELFKVFFSSLPFKYQHYIRRYVYKHLHRNIFTKMQEKRSIITEDGYSYKAFDELKCIFVHIPKCAGISISKTLFGNLAGGHTTIKEYQIIFSPKELQNYFTFTIVRNPWDRIVSAFFFLKKGGFNDEDKAWARDNIQQYENFNEFVRNWVNEKNIWLYHHFRPQYHYICNDKGEIPLNFVGFYENIDADFEFIKRRFGLIKPLITTNNSDHCGYKNIYKDDTIKIIAEVYRRDIELLGYSFDNSSLKLQLKNRKSS